MNILEHGLGLRDIVVVNKFILKTIKELAEVREGQSTIFLAIYQSKI